jgi:hypothetical protein
MHRKQWLRRLKNTTIRIYRWVPTPTLIALTKVEAEGAPTSDHAKATRTLQTLARVVVGDVDVAGLVEVDVEEVEAAVNNVQVLQWIHTCAIMLICLLRYILVRRLLVS